MSYLLLRKNIFNIFLKFIFLFFSILVINSCGKVNYFRLEKSEVASEEKKKDGRGGICNPFGGQGEPKIRATLYEGDKSVLKFADFLRINKVIADNIYFSELNLPTTLWEEGFKKKDGSLLLDSKGNPLVEWFGLKMESSIVLADDQEEGYYQFNSYADDGFILELLVDGKYLTALEYDVITPPHYHCQIDSFSQKTRVFRMTKSTKLKMRSYYFQGPRMQLAFQLFMKKIAPLDEYRNNMVDLTMTPEDCLLNSDSEILREENYYLETDVSC